MSSSANNSVNLIVDDNDAGFRYSFFLEENQYQRLTIDHVQKMIVDVSQHPAESNNGSNAQQSAFLAKNKIAGIPRRNSAASSSNAAAGTPMKRHTSGVTYESMILPLSSVGKPAAAAAATPHASSSHDPLHPGSFCLFDGANRALRDVSKPASAVHLQSGAPLRVVRQSLHENSFPSDEDEEDIDLFVLESEGAASSSASAVFQVESDDDLDAPPGAATSTSDTSFSFHEDIVSMSYNRLMPSDLLSSTIDTVFFQSEHDEDSFDISFATVQTCATTATHPAPMLRAAKGQSMPPTPKASKKKKKLPATARPGINAGQQEPQEKVQKRVLFAPDPVANMSAKERFDYYVAWTSRKKVAAAAADAGLPSTAKEVHPAPAPSRPAPKISCVVPIKKTAKKVATPPSPALSSDRKTRELVAVQYETDTDAPPQPATPAAPAADVETVDAEAPPPASPQGERSDEEASPRPPPELSATIEPTVPDTTAPPEQVPMPQPVVVTDRELQLAAVVQQLQEDVQSLLMQSQTDASRIATLRGALTETQNEFRALQEAHCSSLNQLNAYAAQMAAAAAMPPPATDSQREEAEGTTEAASPQSDVKQEEDEQEEAAVPEAAAEEAAPSEQDSNDDDEAAECEAAQQQQQTEGGESHKPEKESIEAAEASEEAGAEGAAEKHDAEAATAEAARSLPAAADDSQPPASIAPIPALRDFSEAELRALLKQMGYIHHNRLLRRENALLMHQLYTLEVQQAMASKKRRGSGGGAAGRRLDVVVRIRPVGLQLPPAVVAEGAADKNGNVSGPMPTTGPASTRAVQQRSSFNNRQPAAAALVSPLEKDMESSALMQTNNSIVTPLLSPDTAGFLAQQQQQQASSGTFAPADVFLQYVVAENRLQVCNAELNGGGNTCGGCASARPSAREKASVRGVRVVGPPLPQSLSSLSRKQPSFATLHAEEDSADAAMADQCASALRAAAAVQQRALFEDTVAPLVHNMVRGESGTVLSYGQVGSGKTYTMFGDCTVTAEERRNRRTAKRMAAPEVISALPAEAGVVPRAIEALLDELRERAAAEELLLRSLFASRHDEPFHIAMGTHAASASPEAHPGGGPMAIARTQMCELQCSMVELYGDKVRDLLAPKLQVPIYEEFEMSPQSTDRAHQQLHSGIAEGSGPSRSNEHRRRQRQPRHAQATHIEAAGPMHPPRKILGYNYVSPECTLKPTVDGGTVVSGALHFAIHSLEEAMVLIQRGLANREAHDTPSNVQSSRSHLIFTLTLKQQHWSAEPAPATAKTAAAAGTDGPSPKGIDPVPLTPTFKNKYEEAHHISLGQRKAKAAPARRRDVTHTHPNGIPKHAGGGSGAAAAAAPGKAKKKTKSVAAAAHRTSAQLSRGAATAPANAQSSGDAAAVRSSSVASSEATTAAEIEAQERQAQDSYLRRRTVKNITSRLVFVDLAGTERLGGQPFSATNADRLREAQAIGKSLAALGDVMSVLYGSSGVGGDTARAGNGSGVTAVGAHVPFRAHKLTMLLRDALLKPSACVVLACVALSEAPMTALLADAVAADAAAASLNAGSGSERQYWRLATERLLAAQQQQQQAKSARHRRGGHDLAATMPVVSTPTGGSPGFDGVGHSRSATFGHSSATARKHAGLASSHRLPARLHPRLGMTRHSRHHSSVIVDAEHPCEDAAHDPCAKATLADEAMAQQSHGNDRSSEEAELQAQLDAIQANAEAEDRAAAAALWITPRETLSTLTFLSRLWKA